MALTIQTIRNLVSDLGTPPFMEDPQYQTIIDLGETSAYRAAAVASRQLHALFSSKADVKAGPVQVWNSQKAMAYKELSVRYDKLADEGYGETGGSMAFMAPVLTGVSLSEMEQEASDEDRFPSRFVEGMDENLSSTS